MAEQDRKRFDDWKTQGSPKAGSSAESKQEMEEIVTSEQAELEVIKSYCEKDVKKISKCRRPSSNGEMLAQMVCYFCTCITVSITCDCNCLF